jgi:hypothetical protein
MYKLLSIIEDVLIRNKAYLATKTKQLYLYSSHV